jgi:MFS family permease
MAIEDHGSSRKPLILLALLLASFAINLDTTIVNVALPTLARELHASNTQLQWVVDAYNLVFAALLLGSGSVSDRSGRKGVLLVGLTVFGLASIAGGLTTSAGALIATRALMGLGAGVVVALTLLPAQPAAPPHKRIAEPAPSRLSTYGSRDA